MQDYFFCDNYSAPLHLVESISKTPYYYQADVVNRAVDEVYNGVRRLAIKSPTGTGKTLISKLLALSTRFRDAIGVTDRPLRVLYIANKNRLNRQAVEEYAENATIDLIPHSAFSDIPKDVLENQWDVAFIDECHHEAMMSIQNLLDDLVDQLIIGFTADDKRGDGLVIKFEKILTAISEERAAAEGFTEKVGLNTIIDFSVKDKSVLATKLIGQFNHCIGNGIIFFRTESEVNKMMRFLRRHKIPAIKIGKNESESDMDEALDRLSRGEVQFVVNCQKIGEGVDSPNITDVILCRSFNSAAEKKQYCGRAIRPDSPCAVWEFMNPLTENVQAKDVVGMTKYERLLYLDSNDQWVTEMVSGEDPTWETMADQYGHQAWPIAA